MRLLVDEHGVPWGEAWKITQGTLNYTNHTLLPEALEAWPMSLMNDLLPRHMQIIFLINHQHLKKLPPEMQDERHQSSVSIIEEGDHKRVRMGHLAFIGSRRINGVSALHTELMKQTIFADLNAIYPGRIVNKTNGITFRRWLMEANPGLTSLLVDTLSPKVLDDPNQLKGLVAYVDDASFNDRMKRVRRRNKEALAKVIEERTGVVVSPEALFDVQIKRIHEYKRQLLNILSAAALYREIKANPKIQHPPRVKIFAGKAAASYHRAKLIIKLANDIAKIVNNDPQVGDQLKVVFLPNYNVSLAEVIIPAADLSEQISTAGMEASGTGNMKMALNGALTIGTMDGANIEISEAVGLDNIFIFGMTTPEVEARRSRGIPRTRCADQLVSPEGHARRHLRRPVLARRPVALSFAGRCRSGLRHVHGSPPISNRTGAASATSTRSGSMKKVGPRRAPRTSPTWAGSRPIARSANTPTRSGARRRCKRTFAIRFGYKQRPLSRV